MFGTISDRIIARFIEDLLHDASVQITIQIIENAFFVFFEYNNWNAVFRKPRQEC